jgi:hypothetical protein
MTVDRTERNESIKSEIERATNSDVKPTGGRKNTSTHSSKHH